MNPRGRRRDERLERPLEGAMIVQSLVTAFTIAFLATAMFGHVLLLRAGYAEGRDLSYVEEEGGGHDELAWGRRFRDALPFLLGG